MAYLSSLYLLDKEAIAEYLSSIKLTERDYFTFTNVLRILNNSVSMADILHSFTPSDAVRAAIQAHEAVLTHYYDVKEICCTSSLVLLKLLIFRINIILPQMPKLEPVPLVNLCFKYPELAHSVMAIPSLKASVPLIHQFSNQSRFLINPIPHKNLEFLLNSTMSLIFSYYFLKPSIPTKFELPSLEVMESNLSNYMATLLTLICTFYIVSSLMTFNYTHNRKTRSLKQIADEYAQGIRCEDTVNLLQREKITFQTLLEQEEEVLLHPKNNRFKLFSRNQNTENTSKRLEIIQSALSKIGTIPTHEAFITFKTKLLQNNELRGKSLLGWGNSEFYSKMLFK